MGSPLVKPQPKLPQQRPQPSQQKRVKLDFDSEVIGRSVVIKMLDGSIIQGIVTDNSKFWLRILSGEKVVFVHKAAIVWIEVSAVKK
ncbi:MAG: hypothetical protein QW794_09000 [Thermosphaera sp.]